jgi:hypothetical protein
MKKKQDVFDLLFPFSKVAERKGSPKKESSVKRVGVSR